ncbi:MAG: radical SAM protein [Candidatus Aminicenantes bacterium]|nr:radical SAM protein [Candidatus Aminicenantes bacterium]
MFFKDALRVSLKNPAHALFFFRTAKWQKKAAQVRNLQEQEGIHVPPILIFSITNECNLHCTGCYHRALARESKPEMSDEKIHSILSEARDLGISFVVLAGGEPLVNKNILDITKDFPEIIFLVFTNGLLIDEEWLGKLKGQHNFVPVVSLEGYEKETDGRRGAGVYERLLKIVQKIKNAGIFWSVSLTVTRSNMDSITDAGFIKSLSDLGCKLFFFLEYTPVKEGTEDWLLTDKQRGDLITRRDHFRNQFSALFFAVPGDEEEIGGCLSAGRGFVHISADGNVEPCPFAPYSDVNLLDVSLKEALQSEFLKKIRQSDKHLKETGGGCALWVEREWVKSLLPK